ncbi:MAG: class I SAM-dependent methyltransferase [Candidatus Dojkabacteria bacterium]|nr:class I SAM-dependent methyltransferase [Candidatus Dojkabacteria bacterium]
MTNNLELLKLEVNKLDEPIEKIKNRITGADVSSLIEKEFLSEYKRLINVIIEFEKPTGEKIEKILSLVKSIQNLAKIDVSEFKKSAKDIRSYITKALDDVAAGNYSIWAPTYNKLFFYSEVEAWKLEIKTIRKFVENNTDINKSFEILDVGTGTGFPSLLLSRLYPNSQVNAFDNSDKMLEMAQEFEKDEILDSKELSLTKLIQEYLDLNYKDSKKPKKKILFIHQL